MTNFVQIPSESHPDILYTVSVDGLDLRCSCPASQFNKDHRCKHTRQAIKQMSPEAQKEYYELRVKAQGGQMLL